MTPEEMIKQLELLKAEIEWEHSLEYQIVLDEVIKVLEKQIPKKYKIVEGKSTFGKQEFFAVCPSCDDGIRFICGYGEKDTDEVIYEKWQGEKYCSKCGQKLDWR